LINRWSESEAAACTTDAALRAYSSRLLGADPSLVLHGGGNTSVKVTSKSVLGRDEEVLLVKGSGWDMASIEEAGFAPVRLDHLRDLSTLPKLTDPQMVSEMVTHTTRAGAPVASVEAILHAILPFKWVDHTHADAIVTITNSANGEAAIREIFGDDVVVIPYVMPGFDLARVCAERFPKEAGKATIGMVLLNHGLFTFGESAKESYDRMISLVTRAEDYLRRRNAWEIERAAPGAPPRAIDAGLPELRQRVSAMAGFPVVIARHADKAIRAFIARSDLADIASQGPATPDHSIRTKRIPMVGRDVDAYARDYRAYFDSNAARKDPRPSMLDTAPRVILDSELGMCAVGKSAKDAAIVADIYMQTMEIISRATALGGYEALPATDIFDVEYWDLEQAKLAQGGKPNVFAGEIVLVTGAASGIGRACVESFLSRGAAVAGIDIDVAIETLHDRPDFTGIRCDVTDAAQLEAALAETVEKYGGLDMLVLCAGVFPGGRRISALPASEWRSVMRLNLDANLDLMRLAHPLLKVAPRGGRIAVIGSKNVPAPGPGAAAYSASKAALNQLARVAALEWAGDGIRVNSLHPHGVFDTGIWTDEVLAARAAHHNVSVNEYRTRNLLGVEVTSRDVAELAAELCGPLFAKSTGVQLPIDGGSERVI
jgi:rhamnose utilization protein RhaD (predicted bifunctional aldolase and dehydrogenase)/NAD(P)-dependent dehydrogenase (short-subunit alcohol dehydrogenase family)